MNERDLLGGKLVVACSEGDAATVRARLSEAGEAGPLDMLVSPLVDQGRVFVIDRDALLPEWERELSPWRRLRRLRYGRAGVLDPLDRRI